MLSVCPVSPEMFGIFTKPLSVCPKFLYSATSATRVVIFLLHESSNRVDIRLHTENHLPRYSGSGLKVYVWWVGGVVVDEPITLSLQLKLCCVESGCDNTYDL